MALQQIRFEQFFAAPRAAVFAFMADHESFGRLWPGRTRRLRTSEDPAQPNGVGSVREIRVGPMSFEETVTVFEPDSRIEYRVTRGGNLRSHLGVIRFESVPGGTRMDYTIEFEPRMPVFGNLIAAYLCQGYRRRIHGVVEDISHAAAQNTGA